MAIQQNHEKNEKNRTNKKRCVCVCVSLYINRNEDYLLGISPFVENAPTHRLIVSNVIT